MERHSVAWWADFAERAAEVEEDLPLVGQPSGKPLLSVNLRNLPAAQQEELDVLVGQLVAQGGHIAQGGLLPILVHVAFRYLKKEGVDSFRAVVQETQAAD